MSDVREQNDWVELRRHLNAEMDRQVTANKVMLWIGIGSLCLFNVVSLCTAIIALTNCMMLEEKIKSLTVMYSTMEVQYKCLYATVFKDVK